LSAIVGIVRFDERPVERRDIERMMNALAAHGPDHAGLHVAGCFGLGRLMMRMTAEDRLDRQPLHGANGAVLVADLRIDNRDDLIAGLAMEPDRARLLSDAALALTAWEQWGNDAWPRLRGPFAVAVYQPRTRLLTLARDPVGLRALCYHVGDGFVAFATLPKGLFALPDVPRALNEEKIADFLVLNHSDCESSWYRGILRQQPAHYTEIHSSGRISKQAFWSARSIKPVRLGSDEAYAEALREQLDRAVRRQLRSIHGVGCFLSGGLDSSSVAALAARALAETGKRLPAYTQVPRTGFPAAAAAGGAYFDETPYVEAIRQMLGTIDVTYIRSGEHDDFADIEQVFHAVDGPVRNPANLGWYLAILRLARERKQRVLLGGDLGNATISWEGWEQIGDHVLRGRLFAALRQCRLYYRLSGDSLGHALGKQILRPLGIDPQIVIDRLRGKGKEAWKAYSAINPAFAAAAGIEARARRDGYDFSLRPQAGALRQRLRMISGVEFRGEWEAGMLALYGIDLRDPTADLDVVSFCLGIPEEQYLAEGIDRSLIRRASWALLPEAVLTNRRRGMQAADWHEKLYAGGKAFLERCTRCGPHH
jgi:asparagine synthase (glutamine-hydrolysing)